MSKVKVGDKIRVVNPVMAWGVYDEGDIFEIKRVGDEESVYVREHDHVILKEEYEVIGKPWKKGDKVRNVRTGKVVEVYAYQPTHRTVGVRSVFVSHEKGFTFIENGREEWSHIEDFELIEEKGSEDMAKENGCDTIKMTMPDGTVIEGTAEALSEMYKMADSQEEEDEEQAAKVGDTVKAVAGDFRSTDSDGEPAVGWYKSGQGLVKIGSHGEVLEVREDSIVVEFDNFCAASEAPASNMGEFVLHKSEYVVVDEKESSDPRDKFSEGDKVRLLDGGGEHPLYGFTDGRTYEVIDPLSDQHSLIPTIEIKQEGGGISGYAKAEQLEKVGEDKTSNHFNIGDKVRICIPEHEETKHSRAGVTNDEIGTVEDIDGGRIEVKFLSFSDTLTWTGHPSELEVVEGDEIDLSFIRAGREPGEFVVGDIVEVTESRSGHYVGTIGEIVKVLSLGRGEVKAIKEGTYMEFREGNLKLIAPADKRVDIDA